MPVELTCNYCGSVYEVKPSREDSSSYCSMECKSLAQSENFSGENNPCWRGGHLIDVECSVCSQEVERRKDKLGEVTFCSKDCESTWKSDNWTGEDSPVWKGGAVNYYGANWPEQRQKALKRDNHECKVCGETEKEHQIKHGSSLEVHHKQRIKSFDKKETANKLDNLVTLCCECHNRIERTV